ncbi:MAG: hypothetical protein LC793_03625 [Thermomicrobia bacterium]|nr:hypothetical protein [Thermomicrobia bacterium]
MFGCATRSVPDGPRAAGTTALAAAVVGAAVGATCGAAGAAVPTGARPRQSEERPSFQDPVVCVH